jgi:hypothetical protein
MKSVALMDNKPISADAVRGALSTVRSQLPRRDQAALDRAFDRATNFVGRSEAAGGVSAPGTSFSFGTDSSSKRELRVDIQINSGELNIVPLEP